VALTDEQFKALEAQYGRIGRIKSKAMKDGAPVWECVFRKPKRAEFKQFRARAHNPAQRADAQEQLARQCVVHPSKEAFDALLEDYPAICDSEAATELFQRLMSDAVEESGEG
jgi:hypothetical protein